MSRPNSVFTLPFGHPGRKPREITADAAVVEPEGDPTVTPTPPAEHGQVSDPSKLVGGAGTPPEDDVDTTDDEKKPEDKGAKPKD